MMQPEMLKSLTQLIQDLISSKRQKKKQKNTILFVKFIENKMGQQIAPINKIFRFVHFVR